LVATNADDVASPSVALPRMRWWETCTPLADRRSLITKLAPVSMIVAWYRLTLGSSSTTPLSPRRPIPVVTVSSG
jgi:hypothetical protein